MATGNQLMKEISDQFLVCKICLEPFKDPKTLSCLHTFCCVCVQQQYDAESVTRSSRYTSLYARAVSCPVCRKKTDLPTGGVRRLPDNFLVSNLTDVLAKRRCVSKVPPCEICQTVRSRSCDACSKCLDCDKLLCRTCVELHSATKVTQDHSLIDLEGQKDIVCKTHPEETVRFYCERCEECVCVVCTFQEHKGHEVCSFNDGLSKHKNLLEGLLGRSKERMEDVSRRLKVIDKVETLSKELKERIRDLAISYTSQVRAREKELIRKVDEMLLSGSGEGDGDRDAGEGIRQLTEQKAWLQETLDSLQSAANLTEIVVRDKGVEMLLLKKEIQGKMDHLLSGALPSEPRDLAQLDLTFVPGEVKLGDIFIPGKDEEGKQRLQIVKNIGDKKDTGGANDVNADKSIQSSDGCKLPPDGSGTNENVVMTTSQPCRACLKRKRQEDREEKRRNENNQTKRERRQSTRSACTQTPVQEAASQENHSPTTLSQVSASSTTVGASTLHSVPSSSSSSCSVGSDEARRPPPSPVPRPSPCRRARGTMTARQDVRTLKVQTEDSCLRDTHLGHAAAAGSSYPNTGGAIAAAFLKHKPVNQEEQQQDRVLTRSWPVERRVDAGPPFPARQTRDAQVTTDISLAPTARSTADTLAALRQGEGGVGVWAVNGADLGKPDLLAETGMASLPPTSSSSSSSSPSSFPWIRSRKVQTEISALDSKPIGEGHCIIDGEMKRALFVSSGFGSQSQSATTTVNRDAAPSPVTSSSLSASAPSRAARPSSCDVGVMTSFKVKLVPDSVDRDTLTEAVTSHGVGVMTSPDTRTVYIQTLLKKLRSTATGTDYEGQMSKSVSTQPVSCMDAETTMPQVTQEARTTWTDAVVTAERATSAAGPETSDAVTLTTQVQTSSFSAQMRPESDEASTNTAPPPSPVHHHTQAAPVMVCRGTVPDSSHLPLPPPQRSGVPPPTPTHPHIVKDASSDLLGSGSLSLSPSADASSGLSKAGEASLVSPGALLASVLPEASTAGAVGAVRTEDKGTVTVSPHCVAVAAGPSSQMFSCRTTSTDTANLLQVSEKETCTPAVKTVDEWTHTPQPQMINTGVTPHRPAHMEVGVATNPVTLMDQATYTEVKTYRDSGTESGLVVCDSETLTEKTLHYDAQTGADVTTESQSTSMEAAGRSDGCCMTEQQSGESPPPPPLIETHDSESQCQSPRLVNKEMNTTRYRRKVKEVQTAYSYVECLLCQHPDKLEQLTAVTKTFTDTSTDPSPPDTHDVATMALSCLASPQGLVHTGIQTSAAALYDKGVSTSFDFDEEFDNKHPLGLECQDAATSTESLPYIGLLSEIDVDELIVIPEANLELVFDSDEDSVSMVDDETLTEVLDYVEVGTQTILPMSGSVASSEQIPVPVHQQDDCGKHLVSVGVNTMPKVTFEKETCTPIRHLFSKGNMTFFVAKMDKATSTISQVRSPEHRQMAASGGGAAGGRVVKEASRQKAMDSKDTMTTRTEHRDMAVETDSTLMDGRITQCISKLRSVTERLNSPTRRKTGEGDMFFGQSFYSQRSTSSLASPTSPPQYLSSPTMPTRDSNVFLSPPRDVCAEEAQRQTQLHNLLVETDALLKSKESPGVRKAQPITTLKTRSPDPQGDVGNYASKSFPRPRSLERQNRVKMGSQATSPSRLPLSRYNSAPGRIATVPAQTLLLKTGQSSPRASPSKIPVCQKPTTITTSSPTSSEVGPDSESHSTSPTQKVQQRPSLPSISETRTPSSCSETSCLSIEFEDSSLKPVSPMAASHSRTPSNVTSASDTASEALLTKGSAETLSTDFRESNEDDSSSACSVSTTLVATPTPGTSPSPGSSGKQKKEKKEREKKEKEKEKEKKEKEKKEKEKKGFMQRFLPGKKKKDTGSSDQHKEGASKTDSPQESKQQLPTVPPSPKPQKKQAAVAKTHKVAKPKKSKKSAVVASPLSAEAASSPVSTPAASRPSSTDSALSAVMKGALAPVVVQEGSEVDGPPPPAMPPHHYPPLPDPNKTPPPPRKPRAFVYVRQRIMSIQQDNVEEAKERKEKEKEEKEKKEKEKEEEEEGEEKEKEKDKQDEVEKDEEKARGEEKEKGKTKFKGLVKVVVSEKFKVKDSDKRKSKEQKINKEKKTFLGSAGRTAAAQSEAGAKGKDSKEAAIKTAENGTGGMGGARQAAEKGTGSKSGKSEGKEEKVEGKTRVGWIRGK